MAVEERTASAISSHTTPATSPVTSPKASPRSSPKGLPATNKVKFSCSSGGKILPRPSDGRFKYAGGYTRVISTPRNIAFSELMNKINNMYEGDYILKYPMTPDELDALVSVKSDEDLRHMFDEYDRLRREGTSKFRTYLFPTKPTILDIQTFPSNPLQSLEQQYLDAINGVVRVPKRPSSNARLKSMCSSSPSECASPCSLSPRSVAQNSSMSSETAALFATSLHGKLSRITKVHSSPNLRNLADLNPQLSNVHAHENHLLPLHPGYQSRHHHHQHHQHRQPLSGYATPSGSHMCHDFQPRPSSAFCRPLYKGGGGSSRWVDPGQYAAAYGQARNTGAFTPCKDSRATIWE